MHTWFHVQLDQKILDGLKWWGCKSYCKAAAYNRGELLLNERVAGGSLPTLKTSKSICSTIVCFFVNLTLSYRTFNPQQITIKRFTCEQGGTCNSSHSSISTQVPLVSSLNPLSQTQVPSPPLFGFPRQRSFSPLHSISLQDSAHSIPNQRKGK